MTISIAVSVNCVSHQTKFDQSRPEAACDRVFFVRNVSEILRNFVAHSASGAQKEEFDPRSLISHLQAPVGEFQMAKLVSD